MAAEEAVISPRRKVPILSYRLGRRADSTPQEAERAPSDIQHAMYQKLLGIDERITKPAVKYNVGEMGLGGKTFDTHEYDGQPIQMFPEGDVLYLGTPYIAYGTISFDEQQAILHTATIDLNLGTIDPHKQRLLETAMAGYKYAVPIVVNQIEEEGEIETLIGDKVAYLTPNPDWKTKRRLVRLGGASAVVRGEVQEDPDIVNDLRVKVGSKVRGLLDKNITIHTDDTDKELMYDEGTRERPTNGEKPQQGDTALFPVVFSGGILPRAFLDGSPRSIGFSTEHMLSHDRQRLAIETHFHNLDIVINRPKKETIVRPDGSVWDISDPQARDAVARYIYAEIGQFENFLTTDQKQQRQNLIASMDPSARPMVFAENDPMRSSLDNYFYAEDPDNLVRKLSAAMTPQQLLREMIHMTAFSDRPLHLDDLNQTIATYQEQFGQIDSLEFIHDALVAREEQLRTGQNPEAAIGTLLDILPYLKDQEVQYSSEWFAHLIHAGMAVVQQQHDQWGKSTELEYLMKQCLSGLTETVYADDARLQVNHDALFTLFPYIKFMREWPKKLPFGLGENQELAYILRDLEIISASRGEEGTYFPNPQEYHTEDHTELADEQFAEIVTGLQVL